MMEAEKVTMYLDFNHLASFDFENHDFVQLVVTQFYKFEPFLRSGLTKFMNLDQQGNPAMKKNYY